ncbi:MAG: hypothetical protein M1825_004766 [Sarcosagium campestre]|nr:MAG: hypothetical protein M1825_004766 [Sarcosagium campestre]
MPTNLSRYLVSFSDLAWETVDLEDAGAPSAAGDSKHLPMFPRAWQVNKYLRTYTERYIPAESLRLNSRVLRTTREKIGDRHEWKVEWQRTTLVDHGRELNGAKNDMQTEMFDFIVIASGFFSAPFFPKLPGIDVFPGKAIHSSDLPNFNPFSVDAAKSSTAGSNGKIVVVGGNMSGAEAATALANQRSTAIHTAAAGTSTPQQDIYIVTSRRFWALPPLLPTNPVTSQGPNPAPSFLPLDLCLYDLSKQPPGPLRTTSAIMDKDKAKLFNGYFATLVGSDQSDIAEGKLTVDAENAEKPPYVTISDGMLGYLRSGDIHPVQGSLESVGLDSHGKGSILVRYEDKHISIDDVELLVFATGFKPSKALEYLPRDVLEALEYDEGCQRIPLILQDASTINPAIEDLGFVGFYQGPFWGVMEMQARYLGKLWANTNVEVEPADDEMVQLRALRKSIHDAGPVSQFTMGEYIALMETFADKMQISRRPVPGMGEREGPVVPAMYLTTGCDEEQASLTLAELHQTVLGALESSNLVGRAAFSALQGTWQMTREIKSALTSSPSGNFVGTGSFHPRAPADSAFDSEYLYVEEGTLVTTEGLSLKARRKYAYRYRQDGDVISAWFVKDDASSTVDYLFHELAIEDRPSPAQGSTGSGCWKAKGYHLCVKDDYWSEYAFEFRGIQIRQLSITHRVSGPQKDYVSRATYQRS